MSSPQETASASSLSALAVGPTVTYDLAPRNFDEAWRMAEYMGKSDMVPKDFKDKPGNCLIAIQWGAELGLKPMQAIQNIAVINGRPSLWGDVMLALVRASPLCEYVREGWHENGTAWCKVKRRGDPEEQVREFSIEDSKLAGLFGKQGPWQTAAKRMRQMRARAWALRDVFTDLLRGLHMAEEAMDMPPPEQYMGKVDEVGSPPPPPPPPAAPATFPQDLFEVKLAEDWGPRIKRGDKTPDFIIAWVNSNPKYTSTPLSEEQKSRIRALKNENASDATPKDKSTTDQKTGVITFTYAEVADRIEKALVAQSQDQLNDAGTMIAAVADEQQRKELSEKFDAARADIL